MGSLQLLIFRRFFADVLESNVSFEAGKTKEPEQRDLKKKKKKNKTKIKQNKTHFVVSLPSRILHS